MNLGPVGRVTGGGGPISLRSPSAFPLHVVQAIIVHLTSAQPFSLCKRIEVQY